ncbi:hypothetical protein BDF22DRAFT_678963 [Syncephalis plumigaleata]|nr:hypothetical protein BDF22DRAFT_678963 [Syncephalis plumigaleata]
MTDSERDTGPLTSSGDAIIDSIIENFGVEAGITTTSSHRAVSSGTPSPPSLLSQLIQAWINERTTPELLSYESELMTQLEEQLVAQIDKIDHWRDNIIEQNALEVTLYQTEVERVRFVMRSYLRTRLHKIEKFVQYLLKDGKAIALLSPQEHNYAIEYQTIVEKSYNSSALHMLPASQRALDEKATQYTLSMVQQPNLDAAVFCRSRKLIGEIQLPNSTDTLFMDKDSIFLLRYTYIRDRLRSGEIELL